MLYCPLVSVRLFRNEVYLMGWQDDMGKVFAKATKIILPDGVVAKVAYIIIVFLLCSAFISNNISNEWIKAGIVVLGFLFAFPLAWRLINFADKNPTAALFEGNQFLIHEQMRMGIKGKPSLPASNGKPVPGKKMKNITPRKSIDSPDVMGGLNG